MIPCPKCKTRTDVYDSRITVLGQLRRKRICRKCGWRFATLEVIDKQNELRQVDEHRPSKPKAPKVEKPKREPKPKPVKASKEKVRRFDDDDFEEDSYDVPDELRYLISDRGFD